MWRSSAHWLVVALALSACDSQIVLGDSEAALPVAGTPSEAGSAVLGGSSVGGLGGFAGGSAGSSVGGATAGGVTAGEAAILPQGELVWSTDHEVGDFSDWERGGMFYGGEYEWGDVNGYVDIGEGRDGSNGVVADINTVARGETSGGVRMYRRIEPTPAYYRAWFKLQDAHTVSDWWSIFLFHARDDSLSLDNDVSMWDIRVVDTDGGDMALQFFDHDVMQGTLAAGQRGLVVPGEWFEIRAYLDYRPTNGTRLVVWLNDELLFDMKALHTAEQANVFWSIGNGAARLDPADCTLNLDDAAIHKAALP
jgi:hypothetical protein